MTNQIPTLYTHIHTHKISVQVVSEVEENAELLLLFNGISLTWRTKTGKYVDDSAVGDLTNWYVFIVCMNLNQILWF